jgi:hypothetical protein
MGKPPFWAGKIVFHPFNRRLIDKTNRNSSPGIAQLNRPDFAD